MQAEKPIEKKVEDLLDFFDSEFLSDIVIKNPATDKSYK